VIDGRESGAMGMSFYIKAVGSLDDAVICIQEITIPLYNRINIETVLKPTQVGWWKVH
jgi:hypothetical protein